MTAKQAQVVNDIASYVAKNGGQYSEWYVGIAADPKNRLFKDHAVSQPSGQWIYDYCATSAEAREVEQHFFSKGAKGGPGGGDNTTKAIYAYKITNSTIE